MSDGGSSHSEADRESCRTEPSQRYSGRPQGGQDQQLAHIASGQTSAHESAEVLRCTPAPQRVPSGHRDHEGFGRGRSLPPVLPHLASKCMSLPSLAPSFYMHRPQTLLAPRAAAMCSGKSQTLQGKTCGDDSCVLPALLYVPQWTFLWAYKHETFYSLVEF